MHARLRPDPPIFLQSFLDLLATVYPLRAGNLRKAWASLFAMGMHRKGRRAIKEAMGLCPDVALRGPSDVTALAQWLQEAWDYLAMVIYFIYMFNL